MNTLEQLADAHQSAKHCENGYYTFTLDQLRALVREIVGEPVAWISEVQCIGESYGKKSYGALPIQSLQNGFYKHTKLHALSVSLED